MGFSFVLQDVPRDTLVQLLQGGAQSNKVRGPGQTEWAEEINGAEEIMRTHGVASAFGFINYGVNESRKAPPDSTSQRASLSQTGV